MTFYITQVNVPCWCCVGAKAMISDTKYCLWHHSFTAESSLLLINAHKKPFKRLHPSRLTTLSANNGSLLQLWPHLGSLSQVSSSPWESIIHIHCSRHMQSNVRHAIIALLMTPGITHFVFKTINLLESVKIQLSKSLYYTSSLRWDFDDKLVLYGII